MPDTKVFAVYEIINETPTKIWEGTPPLIDGQYVFTDTGIVPGVTCNYYVVEVNPDGVESEPSNIQSATTDLIESQVGERRIEGLLFRFDNINVLIPTVNYRIEITKDDPLGEDANPVWTEAYSGAGTVSAEDETLREVAVEGLEPDTQYWARIVPFTVDQVGQPSEILSTVTKDSIRPAPILSFEAGTLQSAKFVIDFPVSFDGPSTAHFEIAPTSTSKVFTLPFALVDVEAVDWGDGANTLELAHTYETPGSYTVKTRVKDTPITEFRFGLNPGGAKTGAALLVKIPVFKINLSHFTTQLQYCFLTCSGLKEINPEVFNTAINATNFSMCFYSCTGVTAIPETLFAASGAATNFSMCFYGCTGVTAIPETLFATCGAATNFSQCFSGCSGVTAAVPELWVTHAFATSVTNCFLGCKDAANYSSIPVLWGGLA